MLNLFYITNNPDVAVIAEKYGVDRIWIDLESRGKAERQNGMNTVISHHSPEDIPKIKSVLHKSELLVRVQPWNQNSDAEIDEVIAGGADVIMLPMWKTAEEVKEFLSSVSGRAKTILLLETKEAVECLDEVLKLSPDEIYIGLNDLHLSYGMDFLFEPLANGLVDELCRKFSASNIPFGFGGIASLGSGLVPAEMLIEEHYRLGSTRAILSRSFCNSNTEHDIRKIDAVFGENLKKIRDFEKYCSSLTEQDFDSNRRKTIETINAIVRENKK